MSEAQAALAALLKREGTGISWADLTFNPWIGCQKVGPPCDNCYAEDLFGTEGSRLKRVVWGPEGERQMTSPANWAKPLRWQRVAAAAGVSLDVFCASLADWADNKAPPGARAQLAIVIRMTTNLRWLLLTKRIGNVEAMLREMFPEGVPPNVALGITVAMQDECDRDIERARAVKGRLGLRWLFLSMEPLLEACDITGQLWGPDTPCADCPRDVDCACGYQTKAELGLPTVDLVIVGGESGKNARPMHPVWALELGDQCWKAKVRFHFKQWGEWQPVLTLGRVSVVHMHGRSYEGEAIHHFPDDQVVVRVGTKLAGRMLAGAEWQERLAA